jgi:phospholipase A1
MTLFNFPIIIFTLILASASWVHGAELDPNESQEDDGFEGMVDEFMKEFIDENGDYTWSPELKTVSREFEVVDESEFPEFMHSFPGLIEKYQIERLSSRSPYVLIPHKPNYFMPLSYQTKINQDEQKAYYNAAQQGDEKSDLDHMEFVFQLSVKYVVSENILGKFSSLAIAYTNKSFWQAYNDNASAVFRETNHEPEIIFSFRALDKWVDHWTLSLNHQSNGQIGNLSRSWNRVILGATNVWEREILYVRAWYRIPEESKSDPTDSLGDDNPDIAHYLGYGDLFYLKRYGRHHISTTIRNNLSLDENRGSIEINWAYPLPGNIKGFIQYFNGYGESLIDYNQYQERFGIGIKITDWL